MSVEELEGLDITRVRAENPGPLHAVRHQHVGRRPRPGVGGRPRPGHRRRTSTRVAAAVEARGGAGGIAVTHDHQRPRRGAAGAARAARPPAGRRAPLRRRRAARRRRSLRPVRGPLRARPRARPPRVRAGRAPCFTGDAVLGEGSVFVAEDLGEYLEALQRLRAAPAARDLPRPRAAGVATRAPSSTSTSPTAASASASCSTRSRTGYASEDELLDAVWADAPPALRPAAAVTLGAHRAKLRVRGSLASARRRYASVIAAASGVVPAASASSKIVRSVPPTARTRSSARSGA